MSKIFSNFQCVTALWNYSEDGGAFTAGAPLGIFFTAPVRIFMCCATAREAPTSGGGGRITMGYRQTGVAIPLQNTTAFMATTSMAQLPQDVPFVRNNLLLNPVSLLFGFQLVMFSGIAPIDSGIIQFDIFYIPTEF